jgi:AraC-like DNA-binding protein
LYHIDRTLIAHAHREGHLLFHVSGANSRVRIKDKDHIVGPTTGVAVNPWEVHTYIPEVPAVGQYALVLYIREPWFTGHRPGTYDALNFGRREFRITPEIALLVKHVVGKVLSGSEDETIEAMLYELAEACRYSSHLHLPQPQPLELRLGVNDFRVRKSIRLLSDCLDADIDMSQVASEAGLSRPHFFKLFHSQVGLPPKLFWNTMRIERAFVDLVQSEKKIADIGFDLGFSSQSSFSRFFCLNTGMAPTDYRRVGHLVH